MRRIALINDADRHIERRYIKQWLSDNAVIIALCILFAILGVLLAENELAEDQWYIEGTADGLFGKDNRSLLTLCTNYLLTGVIYLLSLTSLRLHWYHILLILFNVVSSAIVCKVITVIEKNWYKYLLCISFLALITTRVYFHIHFMVTATYTISAGCLWLFYAIEYRKSVKYYVFGIMWIVLGAAVRIECISFALFFMGIVWLFKIAAIFLSNRSKFKNRIKKYPSKVFLRYFTPFAVALILVLGIECSQQYLMEKFNPDFNRWNYTRAHVDDYELPDYNEHIAEYQQIGLSYNDYLVLVSGNTYDPDYFTNQMYDSLLKIRNANYYEELKNIPIGTRILNILKNMSGSIFLIVGIIIIICSFLCMNIWAGVCCLTLAFGAWGVHVYFSYIDRLVNRVEWSIWIAELLAMISVVVVLGTVEQKQERGPRSKGLFLSILCMFVLLVRPNSIQSSRWEPYCGMSVADIYGDRVISLNTFGRYLYDTVSSGQVVKHETYDEQGSNYILQNKDTLFLIPLTHDWKQQFPLMGEDIIRASPLGSGENWCVFGQYFTHLEPMKKIFSKWQIRNPYKAMVRGDVRVVFKDIELHDRSCEINTYLKQHYYSDVNFSVEAIINRTVIGRYMQNFDTEKLIPCDGKVLASYNKDSSYAGMSQIILSNIDVNGFFLSQGEAFIEIHSNDGCTYTCATMDNGNGQLIALVLDDIIVESGDYSIDFICSINNQLYVVNAGAFPA